MGQVKGGVMNSLLVLVQAGEAKDIWRMVATP